MSISSGYTPDMDVIKEIPGYKVILKAILKSQIQQLVEQLAVHTDEESVFLTASVSDGTLSHLGSISGRTFLENHEDIKSQFLGFCLKKHHRKKQDEDRLEGLHSMPLDPLHSMPLEPLHSMPPAQTYVPPSFPPARSPRQQAPSAGPKPRGRPPMKPRHEPYPVNRIRVTRPAASSPSIPSVQSTPSELGTPVPQAPSVVKVEPVEETPGESVASLADSDNGDPGSNLTSTSQDSFQNNPDNDSMNESALEMKADSVSQEGEDSGEHSRQDIKVEAISELDMELEITGVEPGTSAADQLESAESWGPDEAGFDTSGATGSSADVQQGYTLQRLQEGPRLTMDISLDESSNLDKVPADESNTETLPCTSKPSAKEKKVYKCPSCSYKTKCRGNLHRHKRSIHQKKKEECPSCGKKYASSYDLNTHIRAVHRNDPLLCELCSQTFNSSRALKRHQDVKHSESYKFICDTCGMKYYDRDAYNGHMNKHLGSKPHTCKLCGISFGYKSSLRRHFLNCPKKTLAEKKEHKCDECGVVYNSRTVLMDHIQGKHGPKVLTCACGKSFSWRTSLVRHKRMCIPFTFAKDDETTD